MKPAMDCIRPWLCHMLLSASLMPMETTSPLKRSLLSSNSWKAAGSIIRSGEAGSCRTGS